MSLPGSRDVQAQYLLRLDTTFRTPFLDFEMGTYFNYSYANSILPMPDGKLIVSGRLNFGWPPFAPYGQRGLARLNIDGSIDPTFTQMAGGGFMRAWRTDRYYSGSFARRHFMDGTIDNTFDLGNDANAGVISLYPYAFHVYEDGSVLMSGTHTWYENDSTSHSVNLIRVDSTGVFDPSFVPRITNYNGNYGYFSLTEAISNDRFILSGSIFAYEDIPTGRIIRINGNGELDQSFATMVDWGYAHDCHELSDGRLIVVGAFTFTDVADTMHVVRLMPNGALDPSFHNDLQVERNSPSYQWPSVYQILPFGYDGGYILAGSFNTADGHERGGLMVIDSSGFVVQDAIADPGCGSQFHDQLQVGSFRGIAHAEEDMFYAYGGFFGYADDHASDSTQRVVIRLLAEEDIALPADQVQAASPAVQPFVWPNPTPNTLVLDGLPQEQCTIELFSPTGQLLHSTLSRESMIELRTPLLTTGIYFVRISGSGRQWVLRQCLQ